MSSPAVPWRKALTGLVVLAVALTGTIAALRSDGFTAVDATVPRATRWFANQADGWVLLADGFSGQATARVAVGEPGDVLEVAQSATRAIVLNQRTGAMQPIDWATFGVGSPQSLGLGVDSDTIVAVGQPGVVAVDPDSAEAVLVPPEGDPVRFDIGAPTSPGNTRVAPDGAVWTLGAGRFARVTTLEPEVYAAGLDDARFTLVGNTGMLFDATTNRVRLGGGAWVALPGDLEPTEVVLQEPGPTASCGWLASGDDLWCVSTDGIDHTVEVPGLGAGGADYLAVAGDAAALVDQTTNAIIRFDWRAGRILGDQLATVSPGVQLSVATATDLVWIDETDGDQVWAINPWGINPISKNDDSTPLLGESGEILEDGTGGEQGTSIGSDAAPERRQPDNDGVDDPPEAVDDPVTARTGASVVIPVTANDFDPDGEAVALIDVDDPTRGAVELASAALAVYTPDPGFVGTDEFDYTITDAAGHTASATVRLTLLSVDAPNSAPLGTADTAQTGADTPVIVDVLLNDIDPERDSLRIGSFTTDQLGGIVTEAESASGLPALKYQPPAGVSGTATFAYRPIDTLGAEGDPVVVTVEIAQRGEANRRPVTQPDAVRLRRDVPVELPVLVNDHDPDGDGMTIAAVEPTPPGFDVRVVGDTLEITARAGARERARIDYRVTDVHGSDALGSVLAVVVASDEPNRPPVATADTATAVVGKPVEIDVLRNDSDPDNDPLTLVSASPDPLSRGAVRIHDNGVLYTPGPVRADDISDDRFTYRISDGHGHTVTGTVAVRVLAEPIDAPPFARDDSATTVVDVPVTIDVLRNDSDPSGQSPALVGRPGCAGGGSAERVEGDRVLFTPPTGESGVFRCTYEVMNSLQLSASASIVISVLEPPQSNAPPIVVSESVNVVVNDTVPVKVLDNDRDPDGPHSELRVVSSSSPARGSAVRVGDTITFTAPSVPEIVVIDYQVADADGGVTKGQVVFRVVARTPERPVAIDDIVVIPGPGSAQDVDVLANDSDPDGDAAALRVQSASLVSGPAAVSRGDRSVRIDPTVADFVGDIVVNYSVVDPDGLTDTATVTLTVLAPRNRPPIAGPDRAEVVNGGTVTVPLGLNDSDPDGSPLTYQLTTAPDPALGSATLSGSTLTFTSKAGAPSGVADIGYRISDGELTADSNVRIAVQACAVAPPNAPDLYFETGYQQPIAIDLTARASNGTVIDVGEPLGAASGVYTPPAGQNGNVTFGYSVRNSCGVIDRGTVTIDVNQPPVGSAVALSIGRFERVSVPVTSLASDDELLTITAVPGQPAWVTLPADGQSLQVNPNGATGTVAFTVVVSDPGGLAVEVPVTISLVNRAPVGQPDSARLSGGAANVEVLGNDADPDGDPISILAFPNQLTFPNGATGTVEGVGSALRVSPGAGVGTVTFEYTIADSFGAVSAPIPVTISVNGAPTAADVAVEVAPFGSIDVALPVSDPDGDALEVTVPGDTYGLQITPTGTVVQVRHNGGSPSPGTYDIGYTVRDPEGRVASAVLRVTVAPAATTTTTTVPPTTPPPTTPPPTTPPPTTPPPTAPPAGPPPGP